LRPRVQKLLKSNIEYAERQEAIAEEWAALKKAYEQQAQANKSGNKPPPIPLDQMHLQLAAKEHHEHRVHIPPAKFYTHELPVSIVPLANLAAYWYLCGIGNIFSDN
jgi:hypothetical protein